MTKDNVFLKGYEVLKIPIILANGEAAWEEKYPLAKIRELREAVGDKQFLAQMMLDTTELDCGRFDLGQLKFYESELKYETHNFLVSYTIDGACIARVSAWWDPSSGKDGRDRSVVALVYFGADGRRYLHDILYLSSEGLAQCGEVIAFCRRNDVPSLYVETNGLGGVMPEQLERDGAPFKVIPVISKKNKQERILAAFDPLLTSGYLLAHRRVEATPFIAELTEWSFSASSAHDDGIDAAAGALSSTAFELPKTTLVARKPLAGRTFRLKSKV